MKDLIEIRLDNNLDNIPKFKDIILKEKNDFMMDFKMTKKYSLYKMAEIILKIV